MDRTIYIIVMLKYAKLLSQEFAFVRVDLYEINNQVFLGELTFTPMNSFKNWKNKNTSIRKLSHKHKIFQIFMRMFVTKQLNINYSQLSSPKLCTKL